MKHATISRALTAGLIGIVLATGACTTKNQDPPPLAGPSEFGTSISVSVSPDLLSLDGASQSLVTITARDSKGAPVRNLSLRTGTGVNGIFTDYGTLSARNVVTDGNGRATLVYTAPLSDTQFGVDTGAVVDIFVIPIGTDFNNSSTRLASIRLVPVGIIVPPDGLQPKFTFSPSSPTDHQAVLFDATTSAAPSNNPIAAYSWDFGDGTSGSGRTATHAYGTPGTFVAKLTISDAIGRSASTAQSITVGQGAVPTASLTFSPSAPLVGQVVNFNASATRPAPGRTIQSYFWDFGDGQQKTTSSALTTHDFQSAGTYTVTLVATDDAGRTGTGTASVEVASDAPTADFSFSPAAPGAGVSVNFNSSTSTAAQGRTLTSFFWNFGDGSTSTAATPSHAFAVVGDYNVVLIVTDSAGKTGRVTKTVGVK